MKVMLTIEVDTETLEARVLQAYENDVAPADQAFLGMRRLNLNDPADSRSYADAVNIVGGRRRGSLL